MATLKHRATILLVALAALVGAGSHAVAHSVAAPESAHAAPVKPITRTLGKVKLRTGSWADPKQLAAIEDTLAALKQSYAGVEARFDALEASQEDVTDQLVALHGAFGGPHLDLRYRSYSEGVFNLADRYGLVNSLPG